MNRVNVFLLREDAGSCKSVGLHTELGGFVRRHRYRPCSWKGRAVVGPAVPRRVGMKLLGCSSCSLCVSGAGQGQCHGSCLDLSPLLTCSDSGGSPGHHH